MCETNHWKPQGVNQSKELLDFYKSMLKNSVTTTVRNSCSIIVLVYITYYGTCGKVEKYWEQQLEKLWPDDQINNYFNGIFFQF